MQTAYKNPEIYLLMSTLPLSEQICLISNTLTPQKEETLMNRYLNSNKNIRIIIYGRNSNDETVYKKYNQLINLGFTNVYLYLGGIFEWLLLQDIYGFDDFPTTTRQLDILKYKPIQKLNISYIENG